MMDDSKGKAEQRANALREIGVVIDTWDDIFSDFDPRPLSERTVSGDFLEELKKRYKETGTGDFIITIHAPVSLKNEESEKMVTNRLKKHFRQKFLQKQKVLTFIRMRGLMFVLIGICSLSFLTLATYYKFLSELAIQIAGIFLMPLGWFGFWEGLSKLVDTSPVVIQDEKLFEKLSKATYHFKYIT
ncbi:MAG: hypothetical protein PHS93_02815 [Candidatus Omnitrophica bacterium]|nr:hypothetical protein [Candidatus Omnitrophota bacterium]MDD5352082.1 hypothetical protein [Candidatus Omnitrophota bacterium]MDD5549680.1 hypothetical protein [Candidatus Omnitrophota bacterium]